jgi:hypothetical protein
MPLSKLAKASRHFASIDKSLALHARLLDLIFYGRVRSSPRRTRATRTLEGWRRDYCWGEYCGGRWGRTFSKKIGKDEPFSPVWMRQRCDRGSIGHAIADEALLQQQEFPDLAGSPAIFLVCLTPARGRCQCPRRNEPVAASSPPKKQRSADTPNQSNGYSHNLL